MCITDDTMRHEITSWRSNERVSASLCMPSAVIHVVLVVDQNSSMNTKDVRGYSTRTEAVYHNIANSLVGPLLDNPGDSSAWFFTLIEMQTTASIVGTQRMPLSESLYRLVMKRAKARSKSCRHYLPALKLAQEVLSKDTSRHKKVVFLSDGAPNDHTSEPCIHGTHVWCDFSPSRTLYWNYITCEDTDWCSEDCRHQVKLSVENECQGQLQLMASNFGQERFSFQAIALGNQSEPFTVLRGMAKAVKHGSFAVTSLDARELNATFLALARALTEVSSALASPVQRKGIRTDVTKVSDITADKKISWSVYPWTNGDIYGNAVVNQFIWSPSDDAVLTKWSCLLDVRLSITYDNLYRWAEFEIHISRQCFWEGAERRVFQSFESFLPDRGDLYRQALMKVVKQSKHHSPDSLEFHKPFCRTQWDANAWAMKFNSEISKLFSHLPALKHASYMRYLDPVVYQLWDETKQAFIYVLVEPFLAGKYTKWNDNAGRVKRRPNRPAPSTNSSPLGALAEDSEEDPTSYDSDDCSDSSSHQSGDSSACVTSSSAADLPPPPLSPEQKALRSLSVEDIEFMVPQCFSHFTYERSGCIELVCDIQGTWNRVDGFRLTDPSIHHHHRVRDEKIAQKRHGGTDKGLDGIHKFMETHQCNALCRALSLPNCKC